MKKKWKIIIPVAIGIIVVGAISTVLIVRHNRFELTQKTFTSELGEEIDTSVSTYIDSKNKDIIENTELNFSDVDNSKIGKYDASATYKKRTLGFEIEIADTTAPNVTLKKNLTVGVGTPVYASDIIDKISEASKKAKVSFKDNLDAVNEDASEHTINGVTFKDVAIIYNEVGEYDNIMTLEDESGNKTDVDIHLAVAVLPTLSNATDIIVQKGCDIDYMYGVSAVDNKGTDITGKIVVDSSKVILDTVGDYEVTYTVTDDAGLTNTVTVKVSIVEDLLGSLKESSEGKRAVASNGTNTSESVKQELVAKQNEGVVANAQGSSKNPTTSQGNSSNSNSNASSAPVVSNPQIGFQEMEVAGRTNGTLNAEQKAYVDSLVRAWKSSKSNDQDLNNTIAQYLTDNGISCSFGTVVTDDKQLVPSWEYMKEISPSTGGIYDYYYVYTNGDYSGDMLICYKTYVDIF